MQNTSQLLLRNLDNCRGSSALLVNCPEPEIGPLLATRLALETLVVSTSDYAVHNRARRAFDARGPRSPTAHFGAWYDPPEERHDLAVVFLPKSRALIEMTLTLVAAAVRLGALVLLVGENDAGIRSSRATLGELVGEVTNSDSARRCTLLTARRGSSSPPRACPDDWAEVFHAEVRGVPLAVASRPGVFSHGRLDGGTRLLLEHLDVPPAARVLDVGCGTGVIGLMAKRLRPEATVHLIDASAHALDAAQRTMALNSLPDVQVRPSDVFSDVAGKYSLIVSNPPFHSGVPTDHRVAAGFFRAAAAHLEPGGAVVVVANRFLPYPALIEEHVGRCQVVAEDSRFRVYRAAVAPR